MRSCSYAKLIWGFCCTCLMGVPALGQFGEMGDKYPQIIWNDMWKVIQSLQLHISNQVSFYSTLGPLRVELYLFTGILALRQFGETGPKYPRSSLETQNIIQIFQHYISHWMRSYSSAKAAWGLSYTCFRVFGLVSWHMELQIFYLEWAQLTFLVKRFETWLNNT